MAKKMKSNQNNNGPKVHINLMGDRWYDPEEFFNSPQVQDQIKEIKEVFSSKVMTGRNTEKRNTENQ